MIVRINTQIYCIKYIKLLFVIHSSENSCHIYTAYIICQNNDGIVISFAEVELQVKNVSTVLDWREETEIAELSIFCAFVCCHILC